MQDQAKRTSAPEVAYERRARSVLSCVAQGAVCMVEASDTEVHAILPCIAWAVWVAKPHSHCLDIPPVVEVILVVTSYNPYIRTSAPLFRFQNDYDEKSEASCFLVVRR
jgi:hypothetical protein